MTKVDLTDALLDVIIKKFSEEKTKQKINEQIVDPLVKTIGDKMQPYIYTMTVAYSLILIPVILMLILIIFSIAKN